MKVDADCVVEIMVQICASVSAEMAELSECICEVLPIDYWLEQAYESVLITAPW